MIEVGINIMPKKIPGFLTESERLIIYGPESKSLQKRGVSFRLTGDAIDILDREAERLEVDRTKALEILMREIRELRKKKLR